MLIFTNEELRKFAKDFYVACPDAKGHINKVKEAK